MAEGNTGGSGGYDPPDLPYLRPGDTETQFRKENYKNCKIILAK